MNIQQMMKQAQQMQERMQKQMADMRIEATAGGGMVTVVMNGSKQVLVAQDRSGSRLERRCRDAAGPDSRGDQRRAAQGRRGDVAADERHDGRHEDPRPVLMSRPDPLGRLVEQLQRLPGIGAKSAQRLAFHILKTPREEVERLSDAMREVKDRVTYCSICSNITDADPCYFCTAPDPRPAHHLRRRGAGKRRRPWRRRATSRASITC